MAGAARAGAPGPPAAAGGAAGARGGASGGKGEPAVEPPPLPPAAGRLLRLAAAESTAAGVRAGAAARLGRLGAGLAGPSRLRLLASLQPPLLRGCWEARLACAQALRGAVQGVPAPPEPLGTPPELTGDQLALTSVNLGRVLSKGAPLQASGADLQLAPEGADASLGQQRRRARERLGLEGGGAVAMEMEAVVTERDLAEGAAAQRERERSGAPSSAGAADARAIVAAMGKPSAREAARMKRKERARSLAKRTPGGRNTEGLGPVGEGGSWGEADWLHEALQVEGDGKGVSGEDIGGSPLTPLLESLKDSLLDPAWQIRHGAALGLRELVSLPNVAASLSAGWLEDLSARLLCVLALDRFGDFGGDDTVAPVRGTAAQALAVASCQLPLSARAVLLTQLTGLGCAARNSTEWHIRHGAMLGLKFCLAALRGRLPQETLSGAQEVLVDALGDEDDDVQSAAAAALMPLAGGLSAPQVQDATGKLLHHFPGPGDVGSWPRGALELAATLLSHPEAVRASIVGSDRGVDIAEKLWPFVHHKAAAARAAAAQALCGVLRSLPLPAMVADEDVLNDWTEDVVTPTARAIFQSALLEPEASSTSPGAAENLAEAWDLCLVAFKEGGAKAWSRFPARGCFTLAATAHGAELDRSALLWADGGAVSRDSGEEPGAKRRRANGVTSGGGFCPLSAWELRVPPQLVRLRAAPLLGSLLQASPDRGSEVWQEVLAGLPDLFSATSSHIDCARAAASAAALAACWNAQRSDGGDASLDGLAGQARERCLSSLSCSGRKEIEAIRGERVFGAGPEFRELVQEHNEVLELVKGLLQRFEPEQLGLSTTDPTQLSVPVLHSACTAIAEAAEGESPGQSGGDGAMARLGTLARRCGAALTKLDEAAAAARVIFRAVLAAAVCASGSLPPRLNLVLPPLMDALKAEDPGGSLEQPRVDEEGEEDAHPALGETSSTRRATAQTLGELLKQMLGARPSGDDGSKTASAAAKVLRNLATRACAAAPLDASGPACDLSTAFSAANGGGPGAAMEALAHTCRLLGASIPATPAWSLYAGIDLHVSAGRTDEASCKTRDSLWLLAGTASALVSALPTEALSPLALRAAALACGVDAARDAPGPGQRPSAAAAVKCLAQAAAVTPGCRSPSKPDHEEFLGILLGGVVQECTETLQGGGVGSAEVAAVAASYSALDSAGSHAAPFALALLAPLAARAAAPGSALRETSAATFGALLPLLSLALPEDMSQPLNFPPGYPETLKARATADAQALMQLLDASKAEAVEWPPNCKLARALRSYQSEGTAWLAFLERFGLGGILGDDMGLGKTFQTLAVVAASSERNRPAGSPAPVSLVVCPPSVVHHWEDEANVSFLAPRPLRPVIYQGSPDVRKDIRRALVERSDGPGPHSPGILLIASYDAVRKDAQALVCALRRRRDGAPWPADGDDGGGEGEGEADMGLLLYLVMDEGHLVRNPKSAAHRGCEHLANAARHRLMLTGTPVQNSPRELWALFQLLMPGLLGSHREFSARFSRSITKPGSGAKKKPAKKGSPQDDEERRAALEALRKQVAPFVLRRTKEGALAGGDLPPKSVQDVRVDMSPLQRELHRLFEGSSGAAAAQGAHQRRHEASRAALVEARGAAKIGADLSQGRAPPESSSPVPPLQPPVEHPEGGEAAGDGEPQQAVEPAGPKEHVFKALMHLRKLCSHPRLVLDPKSNEHREALQRAGCPSFGAAQHAEHAPKLAALREILEQCSIIRGAEVDGPADDPGGGAAGSLEVEEAAAGGGGGHRVLVFAQMRDVLDMVAREVLEPAGVRHLRLDGGVPPAERGAVVKQFNADPDVPVMLLTTKVGGLGLNLTAADTVVFMEHDWNPMADLQAMDRAHRLGQLRRVNVYRLIVRGTLEEHIMGLQAFKLHVASQIVTSKNASVATMGAGSFLELLAGGAAGAAGGGPGAPPPVGADGGYGQEFSLEAFLGKLPGA